MLAHSRTVVPRAPSQPSSIRSMRKVTWSILLLIAGIFAAASAHASSLYWDADGAGAGCGGTGTWDTSSLLWSATSCSGTYVAWPNTTSDAATFPGSAAATITLGGNITLNKLTN